MFVCVKQWSGLVSIIEVVPSDIVATLKCKIEEKLGFQPSSQYLFYKGFLLEEYKSLGHYGIENESVIDLGLKSSDGKLEQIDLTKSITHQEARRVYKVGLAQSVRRLAEEDAQSKEMNFKQENCPRCLLITRARGFLQNSVVCTSTFIVPEGNVELYETQTNQNLSPLDFFEPADHENLAVSVSLGSVFGTNVTVQNLDPAVRVETKTIHLLPMTTEHPTHECVKMEQPKTQDMLINLKNDVTYLSTTKTESQTKAVIYAAPGFGKTELQRLLYRQGVHILDTDDIPLVTTDILEKALTWTSVLTNRLDILSEHLPTIAFLPDDARVLYERTSIRSRISEEGAQYWHKCHDFSGFQRAVVCRIRASFVSDWFCLGEMSPHHQTRGCVGDILLRDYTKLRAFHTSDGCYD